MTVLVPAAAIVGIFFVDLAAVAVEAHCPALLAHVHLEFAPRPATLPPIVLVAQPVPAFAHRKRHPPPWGRPDEDESGDCPAQLRKGVLALSAEQPRNGNQGVND